MIPAPHPAQLATDEPTNADLAAHAEAAIRVLIHRTRRVGALGDPADVANLIAALAYLTSMLPQLLGQLADWLDHKYRAGHLRVDTDAPHPDLDRTLRALTVTLGVPPAFRTTDPIGSIPERRSVRGEEVPAVHA